MIQVIHIGQQLPKKHKVLDSFICKGLCSKSRVYTQARNSRFNLDECPLSGFLAMRLDQHLQRSHKLQVRIKYFVAIMA